MEINLKSTLPLRVKALLLLLMRTFIILFCSTVFSFNTGSLFSQNSKIQIIENNAFSIDEIFTLIKEQTDYNFIYQEDIFKDQPKVALKKGTIQVGQLLEKSLKPNFSFSFSKETQTISIRKNEAKTLQSQLIQGIVTDENKVPLLGVSVYIKNTGRGIMTDEDGRYKIFASEGEIMVFQYLGYKTQEIEVTDKAEISVSLKLDLNSLEEVTVVSTGYQKLKKSSATGAYELITARDIQENPSINIMERLDGTVPGVRFDVANNSISIRGTNTFYGDSSPLVVIDGFPAIDQNLANAPGTALSGTSGDTNNSILSTFNMNDIESISFLKDAAAASIWGSRAANGVIVIETKKGSKRSKPIFNLSAITSVSAASDLTELNAMNSSQYIDLEQELFDKNFLTDPFSHWRYPNGSEATNAMFLAQNGSITEAERDARLEQLRNQSNIGQINDHLLRSQVTNQYNLSVSGGGDRGSYFVSGNYSKDTPVFRGNESEQYSVTANVRSDILNDKVTFDLGVNHTYSKRTVNNAALQALSPGQFGLRPYDLLLDENGNHINRAISFTPDITDDYENQGYLPWRYNAIDELSLSNTGYNKGATRVNSKINAKLTSWANLAISGIWQRTTNEKLDYNDVDSYYVRDLINIGTTVNTANGQLIYGVPMGGVMQLGNTVSEDYSFRAQLDINKDWKDIHHFDLIAGTELRESKAEGYNHTRYGYDKDASTTATVNPTTPYQTIYGYGMTLGNTDGALFKSRRRYLSYYSNANYSLLSKYTLSGSIRYDDANIVGVSRRDRAIPLWSAGAKWNAKNENFLIEKDWLSSLNLRLTYGSGGSVPTNASSVSTITLGGSDYLSGLPYAYIGTPGNQELGWETTKTLNAGLDIGFFNQRIGLNVDVYKKWSEGILVNVPYNSTYGWTSLYYNTGNLESKGYEVNLNVYPVRNEDWTLQNSFNISYNTNEVTDNRFPNNTNSPNMGSTRIITGYPVDNLFVYRWAGLDETGQSQIYTRDGEIIAPSQSAMDLEPEDLKYAGRTTPQYFGGFINSLRYKNLKLTTRITYEFGHKVLKNDIQTSFYPTSSYFSGFIGTSKTLVNRWQNPGDENTTNVPGIVGSSYNSIQRYANSDLNVISGDNIRLNQISLSYTLPNSIVSKTNFLRSMSLSLSANNLGPIWVRNDEGIDPQYVFAGTYNSLAPSENYSLTVNLSF